ncbi:hypothetical protein [Dictyobacter arantiisoli]|uniref:Uncharacterized protein n=1 Tax=Dictyobacter arantiisoli TaxID=2014874 RepID=A0A5A5T633_9CHLR|nr:hypothetical protein [Dictyobacter arantiisoli]GCF06656.1 hypothetical protein KDI_02200 [Dictyobacter arantiisoli]
MFKSFLKYTSVLFFGMVGWVLVALLAIQPTAFASSNYSNDATPTPPATSKAAITLALPTGGNPMGRAGTAIQITGTGFPANSTISFSVVSDPNQCATGSGNIAAIQATSGGTADGNGGFQAAATWPAGANIPNTPYYVCASTTGANAVSTSTFTVLPDPTVTVTPQTVNAGQTITVSGQYWPPQQTINVSLVDQNGTAASTQQANSNADGTLNITFTIPGNTAAGNYNISVTAPNNPNIKANQNNPVTVNASATPTPQATETATPTATAKPTPAATATPTTTTGGNGGGTGGSFTWLIFAMGGLGVILVIVGLTMFLSNSHSN